MKDAMKLIAMLVGAMALVSRGNPRNVLSAGVDIAVAGRSAAAATTS